MRPTPTLLADLELLLGGLGSTSAGSCGRCRTGGSRCASSADVADQVADGGHVVLADPEGTPSPCSTVDEPPGREPGRGECRYAGPARCGGTGRRTTGDRRVAAGAEGRGEVGRER
jgi:hypothetical protein